MWEEPFLSGVRGSGTVFFSGCPLGCVYCQNARISRSYTGAEYNEKALAELFLCLERQGAHNINLVTATHFAPHVAAAISLARKAALSLPIVYNTSGYESVKTLRLFEGKVDVYLTDVRYHAAKTAGKYSSGLDYPAAAMTALAEMVRQTGEGQIDKDGMLRRGTVVRILLLPGHLIEAKQILREVFGRYGDSVYISLMSQDTPIEGIGGEYPELSRRVTAYEYASLVDYARTLGITRAFTQEGSAASESFIPDFSSDLS
jgi:putative pyruvate formate lyase activating enzyme